MFKVQYIQVREQRHLLKHASGASGPERILGPWVPRASRANGSSIVEPRAPGANFPRFWPTGTTHKNYKITASTEIVPGTCHNRPWSPLGSILQRFSSLFGPFRPLNVEKNVVPDRGRQKYTEKRRRWCQNGASGVHMASQGPPRVSKTPPKSLPNSSKNDVLGPGPPRRPPKVPPGSKQY